MVVVSKHILDEELDLGQSGVWVEGMFKSHKTEHRDELFSMFMNEARNLSTRMRIRRESLTLELPQRRLR